MPKYSGGGGGAQSGLFTSFYVNDRTHRQFQNGAGDIVENNYNLDAAMRQRERIRVDESGEGTEIYHYAGGADTPVWTEKIGEEATTWTRNIAAIGGGLGALQTSTGKVTCSWPICMVTSSPPPRPTPKHPNCSPRSASMNSATRFSRAR